MNQLTHEIYYSTCNGFVECKGECPCGIIAVLGVFTGPVLVYIKGGGVLVGFVESIILVAILGEKRWWQSRGIHHTVVIYIAGQLILLT